MIDTSTFPAPGDPVQTPPTAQTESADATLGPETRVLVALLERAVETLPSVIESATNHPRVLAAHTGGSTPVPGDSRGLLGVAMKALIAAAAEIAPDVLAAAKEKFGGRDLDPVSLDDLNARGFWSSLKKKIGKVVQVVAPTLSAVPVYGPVLAAGASIAGSSLNRGDGGSGEYVQVLIARPIRYALEAAVEDAGPEISRIAREQ